MLKQRIITSLILAPLALWALFGLSDTNFLILFSLIFLAGAWEWTSLAEIKTISSKVIFMLLLAGSMAASWVMVNACSNAVLIIQISIVILWALIFAWIVAYEKGIIKHQIHPRIRLLLGLVLLPAPVLGLAFLLFNLEHDRLMIMLLFLLIWGADVAAYTAGRLYGKNKLAPNVSPGKTWEGVIGAVIMTTIVSLVAGLIMGSAFLPMAKLIIFCLAVMWFSIVGDLFESVLKRQTGIKDSSHIIPGHGGVLDRIDSLISATPLYVAGVYLLGISG